MIRVTRKWKLYARIALGVLLGLDALLIFLAWQASSNTPESQRLRESRLQAQQTLLEADVKHAELIRSHLAAVGKQCDDFYQNELPGGKVGYEVIEEDLGDIATKSGLKTSLIGYHQKVVKDRGVTEVEITAAVEGDYKGLIDFINGLERSKKFYVLDNLALTGGSAGATLKLNMALRTYFRTQA
jgi:type IV pilus assembly protein PilO